MMPGGFELAATSYEGSVRRYRNKRLEVTVRKYDDSNDPAQDVITAKTLKLSSISYCFAPTESGMLITCGLDGWTGALTPRAIDELVRKLEMAKQDLADIEALFRHLYPGEPVSDHGTRN